MLGSSPAAQPQPLGPPGMAAPMPPVAPPAGIASHGGPCRPCCPPNADPAAIQAAQQQAQAGALCAHACAARRHAAAGAAVDPVAPAAHAVRLAREHRAQLPAPARPGAARRQPRLVGRAGGGALHDGEGAGADRRLGARARPGASAAWTRSTPWPSTTASCPARTRTLSRASRSRSSSPPIRTPTTFTRTSTLPCAVGPGGPVLPPVPTAGAEAGNADANGNANANQQGRQGQAEAQQAAECHDPHAAAGGAHRAEPQGAHGKVGLGRGARGCAGQGQPELPPRIRARCCRSRRMRPRRTRSADRMRRRRLRMRGMRGMRCDRRSRLEQLASQCAPLRRRGEVGVDDEAGAEAKAAWNAHQARAGGGDGSAGKRLLPRALRHLSSEQTLTALTMVVASFESLDVVRNGRLLDDLSDDPTRVEARRDAERQSETFATTIVPSMMQMASTAPMRIVSGMLALFVERNDPVRVTQTRPGVAFLTIFLSRAETLKQQGDVPAEELEQFKQIFALLFSRLTAHGQLVTLFPSTRTKMSLPFGVSYYMGSGLGQQLSAQTVGGKYRNVDLEDEPSWNLMAALAIGASMDQQQVLVQELREKILENVISAKEWQKRNPGAVQDDINPDIRIRNVNLLLHALNLDAAQISV
ncbi:hypothetical protein L1887_55749 [Cichorium endivia]|nr:hypothetical protein L1887_55749 [Cichorium endivia]